MRQVHGAADGAGVVEEEYGASAANGAIGNGRKKSSTASTDQKENSIVVSGSGSGAVMMTYVFFSVFLGVNQYHYFLC